MKGPVINQPLYSQTNSFHMRREKNKMVKKLFGGLVFFGTIIGTGIYISNNTKDFHQNIYSDNDKFIFYDNTKTVFNKVLSGGETCSFERGKSDKVAPGSGMNNLASKYIDEGFGMSRVKSALVYLNSSIKSESSMIRMNWVYDVPINIECGLDFPIDKAREFQFEYGPNLNNLESKKGIPLKLPNLSFNLEKKLNFDISKDFKENSKKKQQESKPTQSKKLCRGCMYA